MKLLLLRLAAFFALLLCTIALQIAMVGMATNVVFYQHFDTYTTFGWIAQILYWFCSAAISGVIALEVEE